MAENEEVQEGEENQEEKKSKLAGLLVPVLTSAVTAAIVGVVLSIVLAPAPPTPSPEELLAKEQVSKAESIAVQETVQGGQTGIYHNYDPFIVSIFDREKVHYLKVVLSLELSDEKVKEDLLAKGPKVRDAMIMVMSDFTLRELLDNQSKSLLKEYLIKVLNKILGKDKVVNIYFTDFTIQ